MPIDQLLLERVDIQFFPDEETGVMGGTKSDDSQWQTQHTNVPVSIRELDPDKTQTMVVSDREGQVRRFHARFKAYYELTLQHRLKWDDAVTGKTRYLKVEQPNRHGRHVHQWLAIVTEIFA